jgi:hypothetical protein
MQFIVTQLHGKKLEIFQFNKKYEFLIVQDSVLTPRFTIHQSEIAHTVFLNNISKRTKNSE